MIVTLDFETLPITLPHLPPKPVGVALKVDSEPAKYLAWGHPSENNCEFGYAKELLEAIWRDVAAGKVQLLMHNAKFDLAVAASSTHFQLPWPSTSQIHDTLLLAFLCLPYESQLSLKPLSEKLLGLPPDERDEVVDWIMAHTRHPSGKMYSRTGSSETFEDGSPKYSGAYIAYAPGDLVGRYAIGDVDRTWKLFQALHKIVESRGMSGAYARELALLPILSANEQSGMRINMERGEEQYNACATAAVQIDNWLRKTLNAPELNVRSEKELAPALFNAGLLDKSKMLKTGKGADSLSKASLSQALPLEWASLLVYRRQLDTVGNTFIRPWLEMGRQTGGIVYTHWNQVAQVRDGKGVGTRTGRFSTTPSFSNIPKIGSEEPPFALMQMTGLSLPPIPFVRGLIVPWEKDWVLIDRDYSQQEVRISAHFGGGNVFDEYKKNPWMDIHQMTQDALETQHGIKLGRKHVKGVNFSMFYGGGVNRLMQVLGIEGDAGKSTASAVRQAILSVNNGLAGLFEETERRAREGKPIRTWGGRLYFCEDSQFDKPGRKAYAYKLVNYLIQGSAADNLKEVWRRLGRDPSWFRTYLTVHDQFIASVPEEMIQDGHERLRSAMESVEFDVPMLSEGSWSATDWAHMEEYDVHGHLKYRRLGTEA